ncbi:MAG: hypothetical protein GY810_26640 [Aureispira sp.]|nr:hypothetical protein [Aureispira sp.]
MYKIICISALLSCIVLRSQGQQSYAKPDYSVKFLSYFGIGSESVQKKSTLGYNAAYYALLQRKFPEITSQGIGVPVHFYNEVLKSSGADKLIAQFAKEQDNLGDEGKAKRLRTIQNTIKKAKLPQSLINQFNNAYEEFYAGKKIMLSASPNHKTLGKGFAFSPKGTYTTITDKKSFASDVLQIYASFWEENSIIDLKKNGLAKVVEQLAIGILITEYFEKPAITGNAESCYYAPSSNSLQKNPSIYITSLKEGCASKHDEWLRFKQFDSKWYQNLNSPELQQPKECKVFLDNATLTPIIRQLQQVLSTLDPGIRKRSKLEQNDNIGVDFCILKTKTGYRLQLLELRWYAQPSK